MKLKQWLEARKQKKWHKMMYKTNRDYRLWHDCIHRNKPILIKRGCGYYLNVNAFNDMAGAFLNSPGMWDKTSIGEIAEKTRSSIYDTIWEPMMETGKVMRSKLHSYKTFRDPHDMIEESFWECIGYVGCKSVKECAWDEFKEIYGTK